ncbi:MAG: hypothetical protein LBK82_08970, partial [Planctomycetaceae bacterium]|nr:hypothetical protein [Planctomycetaceae bacterium]
DNQDQNSMTSFVKTNKELLTKSDVENIKSVLTEAVERPTEYVYELREWVREQFDAKQMSDNFERFRVNYGNEVKDHDNTLDDVKKNYKNLLKSLDSLKLK